MKTTRIVNLKPSNVHVCNKGPKNAKKLSFQGPKNAKNQSFQAAENAKKCETCSERGLVIIHLHHLSLFDLQSAPLLLPSDLLNLCFSQTIGN